MQPTPESVLKFIRCKCKSRSKNICRTNLYSCRKHGLKWMVACSECRGESCGNSVDIIEDMFERNLFDNKSINI